MSLIRAGGAQAVSDSRRSAEASWSHMVRLAPYVSEQPCDHLVGPGAFGNAFNNLSLHTFSSITPLAQAAHQGPEGTSIHSPIAMPAPAPLPGASDPFWRAPFDSPPDDDEVIGQLILPVPALDPEIMPEMREP
mgnify:CR=1 FL=1|jgi:hypothetical protein